MISWSWLLLTLVIGIIIGILITEEKPSKDDIEELLWKDKK